MAMMSIGSAELYYEVRGSGQPLLFIMGATGDAGHFERLADELVREFTCITYDRRGNSRSPRPPDWSATSVEEQADDAAALLRALKLGSAVVYGSSSGAVYALCLSIRHPEVVREAILHEPPLLSVLEQPEEVQGALGSLIEEGMAAGGPPAALERFWRFAVGDANWEALDPSLRQRMLGNAETFFGLELPTLGSYRPEDASLEAIEPPVHVLVSEQSAPFYVEVAGWLGQRLGIEVSQASGGHTPQHDHPRQLAQAIRDLLYMPVAPRQRDSQARP